MPRLVNAARVTSNDGSVWRRCAGCDVLAALPAEVERCRACTPVDGAGLSREQIDGWACIVCGAADAPMVPVGVLPGWGQVFACSVHEGRS